MNFQIPNNWISFIGEWYKIYDFQKESEELLEVLNSSTKEGDIQKYIKQNKKFFIPASLFKDYNLGTDFAYIIPEQTLGAAYKVDYLLVSRDSAGPKLIFVEFENVNVEFKQKTVNAVTNDVRKGIIQIHDWERWLDENRDYFCRQSGFSQLGKISSWSIYFCLVVSRREYLVDSANDIRGQYMKNNNLKIFTYDHLVDNVKKLCKGF